MSKQLKCILHYKGHESYSNIKTLSDVNVKRILEAKEKREEINGDNLHQEQIDLIPENINLETDGVHLEPCYKR